MGGRRALDQPAEAGGVVIVLCIILGFTAVGAFVHTQVIMPRQEEQQLRRERFLREVAQIVRDSHKESGRG